jgi:uncharacterized membrane protein YcaP (DUF421 family)
MESVLRAAAVYAFLLVVFRIAGKHSLAQITTFDFVLILVIGESTQQALLGTDISMINSWIVIATLVVMEQVLTIVKGRWPSLDEALESQPVVIVARGRQLERRMREEQVSLSDILSSARTHHGIGRLDQIEYAVLERGGGISIIPRANGSD